MIVKSLKKKIKRIAYVGSIPILLIIAIMYMAILFVLYLIALFVSIFTKEK